ncbi:MAG: DUF977 family protein [Candidatus Pacebacteria bacterium]|nr:DUF977 family protein [Candidatus Paceibacterota bacterium]
MVPFSIFALIAVFVAFAAGFFLGKKKGLNRQSAERISGLNAAEMDEMGKKGRETTQRHIAKRKERIMDRAMRQGRITNDDVEDLFCVSDATARNYLNDLEEDGQLIQNGESGRGVFYTPTTRT